MEEIGLFPLGLVLLPTEQVPLHIFEPRYRELIGECLERGASRSASSTPTTTGSARSARSRRSSRSPTGFDDGRLNIVVEGGERFRLVELTDGRSFHTGTIEPLDDVTTRPRRRGRRGAALALSRGSST